MKKFAIKLTKGDEYAILDVCDTKEEACAVAKEMNKAARVDGLMSVIEAEFDESNNMIGNGYKLYEVIH